MIFRWFRLVVSICFITSLFGCGFQLRGASTLSPPLKKLYIQTDDPYGALTHGLREYLIASGVDLTNTAQEASTVLHIISENQNQQLLSVSGTQQIRQYNLILAVTFEVTNPKGIVLMPSLTLTESRTFTTTSDQILGGTNEQNILYQQMRLAMINDIMNRLGSRDVTTLLMDTKKKP